MQQCRICTRESNDVDKRGVFAYVATEIRGGRKGHAERQGLGQSPNEKTRPGRQVLSGATLLPYRCHFIEGRSATYKLLIDSYLTVFRVSVFTTLEISKAMIVSDLRVAS